MIEAGSLRHRIIVQQPAEVADEMNQPLSTWVDQQSRWAKIEPLNSKEAFNANQVYGVASHKIQMRYFDGLTVKHRIKFGTRIFNIASVMVPDEIKSEIICIANEAV